jgi:hypothetical protein
MVLVGTFGILSNSSVLIAFCRGSSQVTDGFTWSRVTRGVGEKITLKM